MRVSNDRFADCWPASASATHRRAPRVLVIGNSDPTSDDELFFAREAARLSGGPQISLRSELYGERPDKERRSPATPGPAACRSHGMPRASGTPRG